MPTQLEIEMEMKRRRDSDYRPLSDSQKINILHEVIVKQDAKIDHLEEVHLASYKYNIGI